ncbi:hypothetical protein FJTKL_05289 [Diaporthe vaccinii]|uniref:Uncharacterized protein n=1 Tax=Diaporthe vaccinii TaxID=105482 RepID=A0ABR4FFS9_9PEZI
MSSIFNGQCVENARATLERLHGFLELIQKETEYVPANAYNVLLYSPIPFIVMFCNTIETLNHVDLACPRNFNTLLAKAALSSGPIAKMQRLFQALYDVALQYVELRTTHSGSEQIHANTEMDSCLSMLGISVSDWANPQQQPDDLGQSFDHGPSDNLEGSRNRRESTNPLVWMDNMFQPDDLLLW